MSEQHMIDADLEAELVDEALDERLGGTYLLCCPTTVGKS